MNRSLGTEAALHMLKINQYYIFLKEKQDLDKIKCLSFKDN